MKIELSRTIMSDGLGDGWKADEYEIAQKLAAYSESRIPEIMAGDDREIEISITACRDSGYCHQPSALVDGEDGHDGIDFEFQAALEKCFEEFCQLADEFGNLT